MDRTLRVLSGQSGQVVKGLRQSVTKRGLHGTNRKTLQGVADYIYRNRARMHYDEYLANGWPIASGSVEGARKNLIKEDTTHYPSSGPSQAGHDYSQPPPIRSQNA
jgi:hypothetical protein